jgi:anthranilate phosphoribosyltransferase
MKDLLNHLFEQRYLSAAEARTVLMEIAAGKYPPAQVAAFLTVFRMRSLMVEELEGFRRAMLDMCVAVELSAYQPVDLVGTGGDGKNSFNISTLAALVVAGSGQRVAKHGNYGASSVCGASNVLEALGLKFPKTPQEAERDIERAGFCYLHAPFFHPAMKQVAAVRKELGFRTFFNLLGPIANPASPASQLLGVSSYALQRLYSYVLQNSSQNFLIAHSLDGYDEISLTGPFRLVGRGEERLLEPHDIGCAAASPDELSAGGSVAAAAALFMKILQGEGTRAQREVVIANAGAALHCSRPGMSLEEGMALARESLASKRALNVLQILTDAKA